MVAGSPQCHCSGQGSTTEFPQFHVFVCSSSCRFPSSPWVYSIDVRRCIRNGEAPSSKENSSRKAKLPQLPMLNKLCVCVCVYVHAQCALSVLAESLAWVAARLRQGKDSGGGEASVGVRVILSTYFIGALSALTPPHSPPTGNRKEERTELVERLHGLVWKRKEFVYVRMCGCYLCGCVWVGVMGSREGSSMNT